jgi:hypothetical protein
MELNPLVKEFIPEQSLEQKMFMNSQVKFIDQMTMDDDILWDTKIINENKKILLKTLLKKVPVM